MIILLFACHPASVSSVNSQNDAETALFINIQAQLAETMPTVVELDIETSQSESIYAEVQLNNETLYTTSNSIGTKHYFSLGGIPESQEVTIQLHTDEESSGQFSIQTGVLPFHPQIFFDGSGDYNGFLSTVLSGEEVGLAIWNSESELVWSLDLSDETKRPIQAHHHPSKLLSYNLISTDHAIQEGEIVTVNLLGTVVSTLSTPLQHHAFIPIDSSTYAYLGIDVRETTEFDTVVGDSIIVSDGDIDRTIFSTWDYFEVGPRPGWDQPFYPQGKDWTHASGLTYNAIDDILTMSLMGIQAVLNLNSTGEIQHYFGGSDMIENGYQVTDPPLVRPHGAKWENEKLLVFHSPDQQSRGSVLQVNSPPVWEQHYIGDVHALALGDIHSLPDGHMLINYGTAGKLQLFSETGESLLVFENPIGSYFTHATWINDLYSIKEQ